MVVPVVLAVEVAIHLAQVLVAQEINLPLLLLKDSHGGSGGPGGGTDDRSAVVVAELLKQELLSLQHTLLLVDGGARSYNFNFWFPNSIRWWRRRWWSRCSRWNWWNGWRWFS
jgi:hypothetical protein